MKILEILFVGALALLSTGAHAQIRTFPNDAPRGYLSPPTQGRGMVLNNKEIMLTPGAQIRDESNIIIFATMVRPNSIVKYKLENGALHRAWILAPQEIQAPDVYKLPTTDHSTD